MRILSTAILMACSCIFAQDWKYQDPLVNYKEGSWVKMKADIDAGGMKMTMTFKRTIKKITADELIVEEESEMMGQKDTKEVKINLKDEGKGKKVGDGEVEVEGKKYKCAIYEVEEAGSWRFGDKSEDGGEDGRGEKKEKTKFWVCKDVVEKVPQGILKMESGKQTFVCKKVSDKIKCNNKDLDCTLYEGDLEDDLDGDGTPEKGKIKFWMPVEHCGWTFRMDMYIDTENGKSKTVFEVTDWELKKKQS